MFGEVSTHFFRYNVLGLCINKKYCANIHVLQRQRLTIELTATKKQQQQYQKRERKETCLVFLASVQLIFCVHLPTTFSCSMFNTRFLSSFVFPVFFMFLKLSLKQKKVTCYGHHVVLTNKSSLCAGKGNCENLLVLEVNLILRC